MSRDSSQIMEVEEIDVHSIVASAIMAAGSGLQAGVPAVLEPETCIYGKTGFMDSVGLVSLALEIERQMEEKYGLTLPIMDDGAFSSKHSPFRSVSTLENYIIEKIRGIYGERPGSSS